MRDIKKILILAANPSDSARLRLHSEVREISEGLNRSRKRDMFDVEQRHAVRLTDMWRAMLDYQPNILHFCGHGDQDGIIVEDDEGQSFRVPEEPLAELFGLLSNHLECVILNSCYSQNQAAAISRHIPYVVGMSGNFPDLGAVPFVVGFYDALGAGETFEFAYDLGCVALRLTGVTEKTLQPVLLRGPASPDNGASRDTQNIQRDSAPVVASSARIELPKPQPRAIMRTIDDVEAPGGAVRLDSRFYVTREHVDSDLYRELAGTKGGAVTVRGSRQVGKTSLLIRAHDWLVRQGRRSAFVDLQEFDSDQLKNLDRFLYAMTQALSAEFELGSHSVETAWNSPSGPIQKLNDWLEINVLRQSDSATVVILDEADRLISRDFSDEFFGSIRAWHNRRTRNSLWERLATVMAISTEPHLLIRDRTQSPFNVGYRIALTDFTPKHVAYLDSQYDTHIAQQWLSAVVDFLGGHPYLTQVALYTIAVDRLTWPELEELALSDSGPFSDHLHRYLDILEDKDELVKTMKLIVDGSPVLDRHAAWHLLRAGLLKREGENYACRCDLYRRFFQQRL